ncbi:MAG: type II and III secretion system protein family protein [Porphyrobacter sp.]|nr:type II and III secretion system protein family protein [Porphyrobacter sp.]
MHRRLVTTILTVACVLTPLASIPASPARAQAVLAPQQEIVLSIGRGELVTVPGAMAEVFVASDVIADVEIKSQRQLYVMGLAGGETTVYASDAAGNVVWSANVRVGSNLDSLDQMLTLAMPDARISVATMGTGTVLLTGTVAAPEDAAEAQRLVEAFIGEGANVIARLRMATPLQVNLRVRFAEVNRSLIRTLGANLATYDHSSGFRFGVGTGRSLSNEAWIPDGPLVVGSDVKRVLPDGSTINGPGVATANNGTTIAGLGRFLGLDLLGALDLGEREGLVTTLSEPNLTALSGETAEFLAGGEFPIPLSQGLGTTTIEYKKYGVSLAYSPTVLASGRISIRVRPEVSELSAQGAVTINGFQVPALTTRRAETTVELGSGQSFMIAGLMSNSSQHAIDRTPGLGEMPILGNLFRSTEFQRGQTELVIVVTPYLVRPVDDSEIRLPTDGFRTPSVAEQLILNRRHAGDSGAERPMPRAAEDAPAAADPAPGQPAPTAVPEPGFTLY